MKDIIKKETREIESEIKEFRRDIHRNPELSHEEVQTSKKILEQLESIGLDEIKTNLGGYGIAGILHGDNPGKTLLIRGDMDALPLEEDTGLEYASQNKGVMHACGHDFHTSILLGTAKVLTKLKKYINGNIVFAFQPAEEASPEGGAQGMIDDGVLENPKVDAAMALHVWNYDVGKVALRKGAMMAQSDRIFIKVKGKSAHASQPENGKDAILAASTIVTSLQSIVSRNVSPFEPLVVTIGTIKGGDRYNVICDEVNLEGTVRIFNDELAKKVPDMLEKLIKSIAEGLGCEVDFKYVKGYKLLKNDKRLFDIAYPKIVDQIGENNVELPPNPASGAEDFGAFSKYVPVLFMWLGMESEINRGKTTLHNPTLTVDENCIKTGIETMSRLAIELLNEI